MATCPKRHVSPICEVKLGAVHRSVVYQGLGKTPENLKRGTVSHCFKWGSLPPDNVSKIVQHVREEERRKEGNNGEGYEGTRTKHTLTKPYISLNNSLLCA
jgi:hypothetical protein